MLESLKQRFRRIRRAAETSAMAARAAGNAGMLAQLSPSGVAAFMRQSRGARPGPHTAVLLHACNKPEQPAIGDGHRSLSWTAFNREVNQLAHALAARGARPGTRVALLLRNGTEALVADAAIARLGAGAVWLGYRLKPPQLAAALAATRPVAVLLHQDYAASFARARADVPGPLADDALIAVGTGGGRSGGAVAYADELERWPGASPPDNLYAAASESVAFAAMDSEEPRGARHAIGGPGTAAVIDLVRRVGMEATDRHLAMCPLYHPTSATLARALIGLGAATLALDHFDAERFLAVVERERVTGAVLTPAMLARLLAIPESARRKRNTSSLRWVVATGTPLPPPLAGRFQEQFGHMLWNLYSTAERGPLSLAGPYDHGPAPGVLGTPLRGVQLEARAARGGERKRATPGTTGELWVRVEPDDHAGARPGGAEPDGDSDGDGPAGIWHPTGDVGRIDRQGRVFLTGRCDDMFESDGETRSALDIESCLVAHPAVLECAVVVATGAAGQALPRAFVVAAPGARIKAQTLVEHWAQSATAEPALAPPGEVQLVDSLPRTPMGRVVRDKLREGLR